MGLLGALGFRGGLHEGDPSGLVCLKTGSPVGGTVCLKKPGRRVLAEVHVSLRVALRFQKSCAIPSVPSASPLIFEK